MKMNRKSYIYVMYWIGLSVRAKSVEIGKNPEKDQEWVKVVPIDAKKEEDYIISPATDVMSIELKKDGY